MLFRLLVWYLVSQAHVVMETTLDPVPDRNTRISLGKAFQALQELIC